MTSGDLRVRRATEADLEAILAVAAAALGWQTGEPHAELFRWKHLENPFGASPMWVAEDGDRIAGFRAFMRWELRDGDGGRLRAVRAVDTATHPNYQRRGIFSMLTTRAVEEATAEGVDIVFNTPNEQSRAGYLKLGWIDIGRLPVVMRPTSAASLIRMARARVPAAKWSNPCDLGTAAPDGLDGALDGLISGQPAPAGLATALSPEVLRWRYRLQPLHYRVWAPDGVEAGLVVFRLRARGPGTECAVTHVLAPEGHPGRRRELIRGLARSVDADYLLGIGRPDWRAGLVPVPKQGPRLTARSLATDPPGAVADWDFSLGDIELF